MNEDVLLGSVWRQHNDSNNFRERLAECCVMPIEIFMGDDKELYAAMKAKLTKKELKLFAMDSGSVDAKEMMDEFGIDADELEKMKFKLYKKLKQDKTRLSFRRV